MSKSQESLSGHRKRIDEIDRQVLELLKERNEISGKVSRTKIEKQLPIYVANREDDKVRDFRSQAEELGLDPEWAEDFLRMIMSSSRASQSLSKFPRATQQPMNVVLVGGAGGMGRLYGKVFEASGHKISSLDADGWDQAESIISDADVVIITVPIKVTLEVIDRVAGYLKPDTVLADFTSNKSYVLDRMISAHDGPVVGLHPMHGPDVANLSKQLMMICPGRGREKWKWLFDQFELWGMRVKEVEPEKHDEAMNLIQGLRHFVALLHGSFMKEFDLDPTEITDLSSPVYRAELMMTGRIFAQDAELYADIVFANFERRTLLVEFFEHHSKLVELVKQGDREGFIREFKAIAEYFGDFAPQALKESSYLINRLADRFSV